MFPCDPRPVAFAVDQRFLDGEVEAAVAATGAAAGVVLRRTSQRDYLAAIFDDEQDALLIVRRHPEGLDELARTPATLVRPPFRLTLKAHGSALTATLVAGVQTITAEAADPKPTAGDAGVLATSRTLFPSSGPPPVAALGNLHLLPYGVQEGQEFIESPAGQAIIAQIKERSTARFEWIDVRPSAGVRKSRPTVISSFASPRGKSGAVLRVASDIPAKVEIEISTRPDFRGSRRIKAGVTDGLQAVGKAATGGRKRLYWRPRVKRNGREVVGETRSFRPLPKPQSKQPATIAVGACATQFGPIFDHIAAKKPDAFVWQGDLNYPDTLGPLAQTNDGYAGIWRDFLANPRLRPILDSTLFAPQRDDHDYGLQDANSTNLVPHGLHPWESLMERRPYYRFSAGLADFWVLDQRRWKSDPDADDTPDKTLLGLQQRDWLLKTLRASNAPFKVICSPCTLAPLNANKRDGSWAEGFNAERDLIRAHIDKHVRGRTIFVTGDTHWTMVYNRDGLFEARACPLDIPTPNDITITQPDVAEEARTKPGVQYADDENGHVTMIRVSGSKHVARLDLSLMRADGETPYEVRFTEDLPRSRAAERRRRRRGRRSRR